MLPAGSVSSLGYLRNPYYWYENQLTNNCGKRCYVCPQLYLLSRLLATVLGALGEQLSRNGSYHILEGWATAIPHSGAKSGA